MKVALQMYSIREIIEKEGLIKTLEIVKKAGFDGVEFAGFYDVSAIKLKSVLSTIGLVAAGAHIGANNVVNDFETVAEYVEQLNIPFITNPGVDSRTINENHKINVETMQKAVNLLKGKGAQFCYHNHSFEYNDGNDYALKFANEVKGLGLEVDVFWIYVAGLNVLDYLSKCGGYLKQIHIKDISDNGATAPNPILGQGKIGCANVIKFAKNAGLDWVIVESERYDIDIIKHITESCAFIKAEIQSSNIK